MGWFRLAGTFANHPKVVAAGNAAVGLYVRLACYCAEYETDGRIPVATARTFGTRTELAKLTSSVEGMRPLLGEIEGFYVIRDYLAFNPSKEQREAGREANAKRQSRWRHNALRDPLLTDPVTRSPLHSTPLHYLKSSLSLESVPETALRIHAEVLAERFASQPRRASYVRTVLANADEHLPALTAIAEANPELTPDLVAQAYARGTITWDRPISHPPSCLCEGNGVVYVDVDDPSKGVIPCPQTT